MKKIIIVVLFLSFFNMFVFGARIEKFYSPNKKKYLIAQKNKENSVLYILVFNQEGKHLTSINTGTSWGQKWALEWITDNKFLLKSFDIGDYYYVLHKNNKWKRIATNIAISPSGKRIACVYYGEKIQKAYKAIIEIGVPNEDYSGYSVIKRIKTDKKIITLRDAISWVNSDLIKLVTKNGIFYWQKLKSNWVELKDINDFGKIIKDSKDYKQSQTTDGKSI